MADVVALFVVHKMLSLQLVVSVTASLLAGTHGAFLVPAIRDAVADEVYHPGHQAAHVTRLHRYEHSGVAAMLEAEALWQRAASWEDSAAAGGTEPRFLRLSGAQVRALEEHHRQVFVQVSSSSHRTGTDATSGLRVARSHVVFHAAQATASDDPAVTGLSSLDSQYVGPIGVGTVMTPAGCAPKAGESLVYLQRAAGGSDHQKGVDSGSRSCHAEDESQIWVVFDTGSTNIWVSSDLCAAGACAQPQRARYDHRRSSTYARPRDPMELNIQFGTGRISGPQAVDDFHIGPFTVYNQTFGMIQVQDGSVFEEVPFEGILGLAFPKMSANGVTPFFDNIVQQKALKRNEFAFYFSLDNPAANAVFWGGVDENFHQGKIEYFKVTDPYYWALDLKSFQVGGEELLGATGGKPGAILAEQQQSAKAIIDTGTTFFTAEGTVFDEVMRRLPPTPCGKVTEKSHPPILYRLQNAAGEPRDFVLSHTQYMTSSGAGADALCSPAFMRINIPQAHGPGMILGEVFLRHYFSVFDRGDGTPGQARVGFAPAAHGNPVDKHLKELTKSQPSFSEARHRKA